MAKTAKAKTPGPAKLRKLAQRHLRGLEVGKAGYKDADAAMDELAALVPAGTVIPISRELDVVIVDQYEGKNAVSSGLKIRRYVLKEQRAADVTGKL